MWCKLHFQSNPLFRQRASSTPSSSDSESSWPSITVDGWGLWRDPEFETSDDLASPGDPHLSRIVQPISLSTKPP